MGPIIALQPLTASSLVNTINSVGPLKCHIAKKLLTHGINGQQYTVHIKPHLVFLCKIACDQAFFLRRRQKYSNARVSGLEREKQECLIQLLHKSSAASPESGLLSDWSKNKRVFEPRPIGYIIACLISGAISKQEAVCLPFPNRRLSHCYTFLFLRKKNA